MFVFKGDYWSVFQSPLNLKHGLSNNTPIASNNKPFNFMLQYYYEKIYSLQN